VPFAERRALFIHWWGPTPPRNPTDAALVKEVERIHMDGNGWMGVGYNFVVDQAGAIFEGRGWTVQGAHCPGHNRSGLGVLLAVGKGGPQATDAALRSARWLYDEACRRAGRSLLQRGHSDGIATQCPGPDLLAWVRSGMPAQAAATYTVDDGDTLWAISQRHGVTVDALRRANGLTGDLIHPGDVLTIPAAGKAPSAPAPKPPAKPAPAPQFEPFPGAAWFRRAPRSSIVTAMGKRLVAEGCSRYRVGPGPQWTDVDRQSYAAWQHKLGFRGADADGWPGKTSWDRLRVPKS
jgi:hypothetical protein